MNSFKNILLPLLLLFPLQVLGLQFSKVDSLFESYPKTEVLVLGTFHFKDVGLDSYKPKFDVDIKSPKRQEELDYLLSKLEIFNPDGIGLEFKPGEEPKFIKEYRDYLDGNFTLPSNEIYQIGFKLAGRLGHDTVYGIDADARYFTSFPETQEEHEALEQKYVDSLKSYAPGIKNWYSTYKKMWQIEDSLKTQVSLVEYLLYLNDPKTIERGHGIYLVNSFKLGMGMTDDYFGVDMKTAWYNRNLRILQNIYRLIEETQAKRVVVIIGEGHLPIIEHVVVSSPELTFVELAKILE